jgi:hypothetical protein
MWDATRKRGEKATVEKLRLGTKSEVGVGKESRERPKPSSSSDVSCQRRREAASKRASGRSKRMNLESNCTEFESVSGQSGGAGRRHHLVEFQLKPVVCIVKFDVTENQLQKKKMWTELRRESGCSRRMAGC